MLAFSELGFFFLESGFIVQNVELLLTFAPVFVEKKDRKRSFQLGSISLHIIRNIKTFILVDKNPNINAVRISNILWLIKRSFIVMHQS